MGVIQIPGVPVRRWLSAGASEPILLAALRSTVLLVLTLIFVFVLLPAALAAVW